MILRLSKWLAFAANMLLVICGAARAEMDGRLFGGPAKGDLKLRDVAGTWMVVDGTPTSHTPVSPQSVKIGIVDSGVMGEHPQLVGLVQAQKDFTGQGPDDEIGHGTVVAILSTSAIVTAISNGKQFDTPKIFSAKVAKANGTFAVKDLVRATAWLASLDVQIVNMSLGLPVNSKNHLICTTISKYPKILFVAAAGNSGPAKEFFPAACKTGNILSVAAPEVTSGPGEIVAPDRVRLVPQASAR